MAPLGRLIAWIVMLSLPLQSLSSVSLRGCATVMQVQLDKASLRGLRPVTWTAGDSRATQAAVRADPSRVAEFNPEYQLSLRMEPRGTCCGFSCSAVLLVSDGSRPDAVYSSTGAPPALLGGACSRAEAPLEKPPRL